MTLEGWIPALLAAWRGGSEAPDERLRLIAALRTLSAGLTRQRGLVGERYLDDRDLLGAYLLGYWPVSYAQFRSVLGELGRAPGRVLDLGSGPGPAAMAALDLGASSALCLDRSRRALDIVEHLGRLVPTRVEVAEWSAGEAIPEGPFDTVLLGHVVNELHPGALNRRAEFLLDVAARLAPGGVIVIVEPALRETSRELLTLRDELVRRGLVVRAPCLRQTPCPALDRDSDWCHAERPFDPPTLVAELAAAASLHRDTLKMSYLILGTLAAPLQHEGLFRIVSEPLHDKGRLRYVGCGSRARAMLTLLSRHIGPKTEAFVELHRGDVVGIDQLRQTGEGLRVEKDAVVQVVAPAGAPLPTL